MKKMKAFSKSHLFPFLVQYLEYQGKCNNIYTL